MGAYSGAKTTSLAGAHEFIRHLVGYTKLCKKLSMLRKFKIKLNRENLEKIYFTYIRPVLEYACELWDGCTILDLNKTLNGQSRDYSNIGYKIFVV
jgi:hypothetical protein